MEMLTGASSPDCKAFGSRHSILVKSKKLNTLKSEFLDLSEMCGHWANCCPKSWKGRSVDKENHNLPEQKLRSRNLCGNQYWGRKTWTVTEKLLEDQCGQVCELQTSWGSPHNLVSFISQSSSRCRVDTGDNTGFLQEERKSNHFKIFQSILFFITRATHQRNYFTKSYWGFIRA